MNSDQYKPPADAPWKAAGVGHYSTRSCFFCGQPGSQRGGKIVGRLRLWKCAKCLEGKE